MLRKICKIVILFSLVASISEAIRIGEWTQEKYYEAIESFGPEVNIANDELRGPGIFLEESI